MVTSPLHKAQDINRPLKRINFKSVQAGLRQQLVVAQRAPPMKDGALDWRVDERILGG